MPVSWSKSELMVRFLTMNMFKPSSNCMLCFTDHSKAVLLLWILFVTYVSCLFLLCCLVCSLQPCDHLLGKSWSLGSLVCDVLLCVLSLSHMVSRVRCGTWLNWFLIFAFFLLWYLAHLSQKFMDGLIAPILCHWADSTHQLYSLFKFHYMTLCLGVI